MTNQKMTANKISQEYTQEIDIVICLQQRELANLGQGWKKTFHCMSCSSFEFESCII